MKKKLITMQWLLLILATTTLCSCKKIIAIESPKNQLSTDKVFADTASATAALLNIYDGLQNQEYSGSNPYISVYADESLTTQTSNSEWNQSRITPLTSFSAWSYSYSAIYQSNLILEQAPKATKLPAAFVTKILGEAKFLRAYAYFYLINYYGRIPLITSSNVDQNRSITQSDSAHVYDQIINDLTDARNTLSISYQGTGKVRANRACATAFLAKVYFFQKKWSLAEQMSSEVISSGLYTPLEPLANVYKASGKESILQLATQTGFVTEAATTIPSSATVAPTYYFTDSFFNSFETGDQRKTAWIGTNNVILNGTTVVYHYPSKYKNRIANTTTPENLVVMRIAEQYLIRAESRVYQNKISGANSAEEDVNLIRARAGLTTVHFTDQNTAIPVILNENRHELFFENSFRFLDLKRTGKLQSVMSANKPTWANTSALLPIPATEITYNPNLTQNNGY